MTTLQGAPAANVTVTFTLPSSGASAAFQGAVSPLVATAATNAQGLATSPSFIANPRTATSARSPLLQALQARCKQSSPCAQPRPSRSIDLAPAILNFEHYLGLDAPGSQLITVTAPETGRSAITVDQPWLKAARVGAPAPATFGIQVTVDSANLPPGTYYGNKSRSRRTSRPACRLHRASAARDSIGRGGSHLPTHHRPAGTARTVAGHLRAYAQRAVQFRAGCDHACWRNLAERERLGRDYGLDPQGKRCAWYACRPERIRASFASARPTRPTDRYRPMWR